MRNKAVYPHSIETAQENNEFDLYHESVRLNRECAEAIDKAIQDSNYELYHYDLKTAATAVMDEYGADRVAWVLANILQNHDYDGRFSHIHKEWAKDFELPAEPRYVCNTHPAVLDGFIHRVRQVTVEHEHASPPDEEPESGFEEDEDEFER